MPANLHELDWPLFAALAGVGLLAALLAARAGRVAIPRLVRRKLNDGVARKASDYLNLLNEGKKYTPTMGGVFLVPALVASIAIGAMALTLLGADVTKTWAIAGMAVFVLVSHAALGMADDLSKLTHQGDGLRARTKLVVQTILALVCCTLATALIGPENATLHAPGIDIALGWWLVPFGALVMVGAGNAYNLTDGLDGLAGGTGAVAFHALALSAALLALAGGVEPDLGWNAAMIAIAASGALVGFLFWNRHPARVFMGDTGSLSLGALLGLVAVIGRIELVLVVAGGVFVAEALSVMVQVVCFKLTGGRRILRCSPLHHHYQFGGWHETKVTRRFVAAGMLLAAAAIALLPMFRPRPAQSAPALAEQAPSHAPDVLER